MSMTPQRKQQITAKIRELSDTYDKALAAREKYLSTGTSEELREKYRLVSQHLADGGKLLADEVTRIIKAEV